MVLHFLFFPSQDQEEIVIPTDPATGKVDYIELDSPVELLHAILSRSGEHGLVVDQLCSVSQQLHMVSVEHCVNSILWYLPFARWQHPYLDYHNVISFKFNLST